jgi:uncharacterized membrane protein YoaK (UPF0700 family)
MILLQKNTHAGADLMESISINKSYKNERLLINYLILVFYIITAFLMSYLLTNEYLKTSIFYCSILLLAVLFASLAEHTNNTLIFHFCILFSCYFSPTVLEIFLQ